jgi:broad specificity phosphatase PhoE
LVARALTQRGVRPDLIRSGALKRQRSTAQTCCESAPYEQPIVVDPRWDEYGHDAVPRKPKAGDPEPDSGRAVQVALDAALIDWVTTGSTSANGLTWIDFKDGVLAAGSDLMDSLGRGGTGLVFTSAGVIATICAELLGVNVPGFVALNRVVVNTGITKIVRGRAGTNVLSFNDHAHLEGDAALVTYR